MRVVTHSIILVAALATPSIAGDASWLLCKGTPDVGGHRQHVVISALEHRAAGGASRDLDVTLLRGGNVSRGRIRKIKAAPAKLAIKHTATARVVFDGTLKLATDLSSLELDGTLDPSYGAAAKAKRVPVRVTLTCETLDDGAIGH